MKCELKVRESACARVAPPGPRVVSSACFLFPGQSSRRSGMLRRATTLGARSREVLEEANDTLGRDLLATDDEPLPACNRDVQVGVFVATQMHLAAFDEAGASAMASLGLSLGEYAHLVHIGALARADALRLVDARGALYDDGPAGKMVAVFPLPHEELAEILATIDGVVEIANVNSPSQHVIAGESGAVDRVLEALDRDYPVQATIIEHRIPMHSSVFLPVAERLRAHLEVAPWRTPHLPYRPNVDAAILDDPTPSDFVARLTLHVHRPVLWRTAVEACVAECPDVVFVEVGPGRVLSNLLHKRWLRNKRMASDTDDLRAGVEAAVAEMAAHG
jgi:[acyl-carrier-protein] S-malonyltransferase